MSAPKPIPSSRMHRRRFLRNLGCGFLSGLAEDGVARPLQSTLGAWSSRPGFEIVPNSASGIIWRHVAGLSPNMYLPETVGPGCAFIDYDNDGWMDLYLVNSGPCDFYNPPSPLSNALYRNNRDGTFTDVTSHAGVHGSSYGMGVAVGDYDGDGYPDMYVTQYPRSILYHNNGDGTFTDVTSRAGVSAPGWATSAVWFDYDNDGRLDLFVCRFVDFDKSKNVYCGYGTNNDRWYCKPNVYRPMPCWLFHNNGDGTFTDVSVASGIGTFPAKAWGVVAADINNDGHLDLFVGNDTIQNFLFANRGKGQFEEIGALAGVAYNAFGLARSGMGVDAADYDQDGWLDLFVCNVDHETYSLYHNNHQEGFDDVSIPAGIASVTRLMSGWGVKFLDFDNDGDLDLLICNGHPDLSVEKRMSGVKYREPLLLFRNTTAGWTNVSPESGPAFSQSWAARGLALGDFNNDGAVDALVAVNDGPPVLIRNDIGRQHHWLGIRLIGTTANRDAIGAKVHYRAGDLVRHRSVVGGGSYLSSHDPRTVLGIGQRSRIDSLTIMWPKPSDRTEHFTNLPIDRYITVVEGRGRWE
jgi:hypothetical protein